MSEFRDKFCDQLRMSDVLTTWGEGGLSLYNLSSWGMVLSGVRNNMCNIARHRDVLETTMYSAPETRRRPMHMRL